MTTILRILFIVGSLILMFIIFRTISKKTISVRYALMWLAFSFALLVFAVFPQIVTFLSAVLDFESEANMIYVLVIACLILMLLSLTTIVSKQTERIQVLIQEVAILKSRADEHDGF